MMRREVGAVKTDSVIITGEYELERRERGAKRYEMEYNENRS